MNIFRFYIQYLFNVIFFATVFNLCTQEAAILVLGYTSTRMHWYPRVE